MIGWRVNASSTSRSLQALTYRRSPKDVIWHSHPRCLSSIQNERIVAPFPRPEASNRFTSSPSPASVEKDSYPSSQISPDLPSRLDKYRGTKASRDIANRVGGVLEAHYKPHELITQPPTPREITLELLLAAGAHLGHATALWNPGNQRYIFGIRQGIHLISLDITASHLRRAAKVVHGVSQNGGVILYVGTREGHERAVIEAARRAGGYHVVERWIPGTITNKQQLLADQKLRVLNQLDEEVPISENLKGLEKRNTISSNQQAIAEDAFLQAPPGTPALRPDLVICFNPLENQTLLQECSQYRIPTIGIVDTDCDPECVTYPIPANDDSLRCVQLIAGILGKAGQEGRLARYESTRTRREDAERNMRRDDERRKLEAEKLQQAQIEREAEAAAQEARQHQLEQP